MRGDRGFCAGALGPAARPCAECGTPFIPGLHVRNVKTCSPECKETRRLKKIAEWKAANGPRIKATAAAYYAEDPDRQAAATAAWREANPEAYRASQNRASKNHYAKNVEKCRAVSRAYSAAHPELFTFYRGRMRARVRKAKALFDQLAKINPAVYDQIAGVKDKGQAMIAALKAMGIEVHA